MIESNAMKATLFILAAALALAGCTTIIDERNAPGVYNGERYEIRTRMLEGPNGPYESSSVVYKGITQVCRIDSPGDCEKAARYLIDSFFDRGF